MIPDRLTELISKGELPTGAMQAIEAELSKDHMIVLKAELTQEDYDALLAVPEVCGYLATLRAYRCKLVGSGAWVPMDEKYSDCDWNSLQDILVKYANKAALIKALNGDPPSFGGPESLLHRMIGFWYKAAEVYGHGHDQYDYISIATLLNKIWNAKAEFRGYPMRTLQIIKTDPLLEVLFSIYCDPAYAIGTIRAALAKARIGHRHTVDIEAKLEYPDELFLPREETTSLHTRTVTHAERAQTSLDFFPALDLSEAFEKLYPAVIAKKRKRNLKDRVVLCTISEVNFEYDSDGVMHIGDYFHTLKVK